MVTVSSINEWLVCTYVSRLGAYIGVHVCYICVTVFVSSEWSKQCACTACLDVHMLCILHKCCWLVWLPLVYV